MLIGWFTEEGTLEGSALGVATGSAVGIKDGLGEAGEVDGVKEGNVVSTDLVGLLVTGDAEGE
jgi:hypothetical protein